MQGTQESSMRMSVLAIVGCCSLVLLSVGFHIIWFTLHYEEIDWAQLSVFVGIGLGGLLMGVLFNKWKQLEKENEEKADKRESEKTD